MRLTLFLKDKWLFLTSQGTVVLFIALLLSILNANAALTVLMCLTVVFITAGSLALEYYQKNRFYSRLLRNLDELDKKYYIASLTDEPNFAEGVILTDVLRQATKSMNDDIAAYRKLGGEYREYIETWIHEIKIPISCIDLICENNKNDVTAGIRDELTRIDGYVEQALYYARSTDLDKDYIIRAIDLFALVRSAVKKHSKQLIALKSELTFDELDCTVYGDPKWLEFILSQIVSNSIKYRRGELKLSFSALEYSDRVCLCVRDNGIGIRETDLPRVFDKGFTGQNGREYAKSTGIGLYLCRRLCDKMHLGIAAASESGKGTEITLTFPKDSRLLMAD